MKRAFIFTALTVCLSLSAAKLYADTLQTWQSSKKIPTQTLQIASATVTEASAGQLSQNEEPPIHGEETNEEVKEHQKEQSAHESGHHGGTWVPPFWSVSGFIAILLCIAIIPLVKGHWWESNLHKGYVSFVIGAPFFVYLIFKAPVKLEHTLLEYMSFIILLGSLFYVTGGIYLQGDIRATPRNNLIFLAIGSLLASFAGTTGAAMLLIRPVIRTNSERKHIMHTIIFFIFLVCNIGGCLTPIGDPPLFMGYLKGVPFTWTFSLWKEWAVMCGTLLFIYYFLDRHYYKLETPKEIELDKKQIMPLALKGKINILWLIGILASIYFLTPNNVEKWLGAKAVHFHLREIAMLLLALISHLTTPKGVREAQSFTMNPIIEVAVLFACIFVTMIPALLLLEIKGPSLGVTHPWQFYWFSGGLSSFLDNTPTYLVFFELARSIAEQGAALVAGVEPHILAAISIGAVFMGANTYIGNGPNFMVKAIAEENSIKMPSFFGYMGWSGLFLIPLFIVITFIFFV